MSIHRDDGTLLSEYGKWCPLVEIGVGCREYDNRPKACAKFECFWLASQDHPNPLPIELRPDKTRVVLVAGEVSMVAHVDPHRPDAYRTGFLGQYLNLMGREVPVFVRIGSLENRVAVGPLASKMVLDALAAGRGVDVTGMNPADAAAALAKDAAGREGP